MRRQIYRFVLIFVLVPYNIEYINAAFNEPEPCLNRNDFQCKNGVCIDMAKECNGEPDCADHSDESDCGMRFFLSILLLNTTCIIWF